MLQAFPTPITIRFADYEVDLPGGRLFRRGARIRLREQCFQVLAMLLEHAGEVVTRQELCRRLWSEGTFVDFDNSLNSAIARLRLVLHDSPVRPRFIETLPKRGYRFIADVSNSAPAAVQTSTRSVRLVVLPFVNLSGESEHEYFSDGMTEEMITELARLAPNQLLVIARSTAMHYKGRSEDITQIGQDLKVDYVVEGSAHLSGDRANMNVQLIQVGDQLHLFAQRYACERCEILATVNAAARAIAAQIGITFTGDGLELGLANGDAFARKSTEDVRAYDLYLKSRHQLFMETPESTARAKEYLEEAVTLDPEFAAAYDTLAEIYWYLGFLGFIPPREACSTGIYYALRAIEIDSMLAETHALLGMYRKEHDFDWKEVQREMALALKLNPSSPVVRLRYAISGLMVPGHVHEAIVETKRALEWDPLSTFTRFWLGVMLWLGRDYDGAIEEGRLVLKLAPASYLGHCLMGTYCREKGMFAEAIEAHRRSVELSGGSSLMLGWFGLALAQGGEVCEARVVLERLDSIARGTYVPSTSFAWIHLGLGEIDNFFSYMDRAVDERDPMIGPIKSYPFFDLIRTDSRYLALLRKMNLHP